MYQCLSCHLRDKHQRWLKPCQHKCLHYQLEVLQTCTLYIQDCYIQFATIPVHFVANLKKTPLYNHPTCTCTCIHVHAKFICMYCSICMAVCTRVQYLLHLSPDLYSLFLRHDTASRRGGWGGGARRVIRERKFRG